MGRLRHPDPPWEPCQVPSLPQLGDWGMQESSGEDEVCAGRMQCGH